MADVLNAWLSSLDAQQLMSVQSATSARELSFATTNLENTNRMAQPHGHGAIAKSKKATVAVKNAKGKNTRPLNSFMGFRCYYSVLFEDFEQKIISGYIVFLWERDPCKAKWALAAKAYSVIRDQVGKEHAPLDVFLMLVAEPLGIVQPQDYLAVMGWEISIDNVGMVSLVKNDAMEIDSNILSTNISVEDIIAYACQNGYAGASGSIVATPSGKPMMAMAASEQLHLVRDSEKGGKDELQQVQDAAAAGDASGYAGDENEGATAVTQHHDNLTAVSVPTQNSLAVAVLQPAAANVAPITPTATIFDSTDAFNVENIMDFDPEADRPFFDPSSGDAWDAFDISEWVNADAYTE